MPKALGWLLPEAGAAPYLSAKFQLDVEKLENIPAQIEERLRASLARLEALYESDFGRA